VGAVPRAKHGELAALLIGSKPREPQASEPDMGDEEEEMPAADASFDAAASGLLTILGVPKEKTAQAKAALKRVIQACGHEEE
jgi:hypothetical protein